MSNTTLIEVERSHLTTNGERFRVWLDGEILIESCREPLCDAARALVAKGIDGRVVMRRKGDDAVAMSGLIAILAAKTVSEGQTATPRFVDWVPFNERVPA